MLDNNLIVLKAIQAQIESPARAVVNCEGAFVRTRLIQQGHTELAKQYWQWICGGAKYALFGEEVLSAQDVLKQIDDGVTMPEWGTKGT